MFGDGLSIFYLVDMLVKWGEGNSRGFSSTTGVRTPQLFLQELTHLASPCTNAVAYTTLHCDVEGVESPLEMYHPGQPWPKLDPDKEQLFMDQR